MTVGIEAAAYGNKQTYTCRDREENNDEYCSETQSIVAILIRLLVVADGVSVEIVEKTWIAAPPSALILSEVRCVTVCIRESAGYPR